jgi:hypothetical protein
MNQQLFRIVYSIVTLLFLSFFSDSLAQQPGITSEKEVRSLIQASLSKDYKVADEAISKLSKLTNRNIDVVLRVLHRGPPCERTKAAQIVVHLDRDNKELIPVLIELSTGGRESSSEEELLCRRGATFLLAFSVKGIRVLTGLLKNGENLFIRRSAIFAFDELTETGNYPEGSLEAMKEAIPVIAQARELDDDVMQNMSNEVLWQIIRQGDKDLSPIAKKYVSQNSK